MQSRTTEKFRLQLAALPQSVQDKAAAAYGLWSTNPQHPSLRYKKMHATLPVYSVRIDRGYRAVGVVNGERIIWFWIGAHSEYEILLKKL